MLTDWVDVGVCVKYVHLLSHLRLSALTTLLLGVSNRGKRGSRNSQMAHTRSNRGSSGVYVSLR